MRVQPKRKRLLVTPSEETWRLLEEFNELTGKPRAAIVSELLDSVAEVVRMQLDALRKIKESPQEARRLLTEHLNEAVALAHQAQLDLDAAADGRTVKGKRARRRNGAS